MSAPFVDTNVLLYAISREDGEQAKRERANAVLRERRLGLSIQVLQEFYVQATRQTRQDAITHEQALLLVEAFMRFQVKEITKPLMRAALATRARFRISYWDAAIIEAARALGCNVVLSEDLSDGQDYAGVRIENPFAGL
ncbi:MAG TPA: PIN domain-containing protein [Solirubrobacteraceae bacterium]|nr:PIN domain-containing protein [Solirubrobacteraceae bacterium]